MIEIKHESKPESVTGNPGLLIVQLIYQFSLQIFGALNEH
jgi:hypothetical protein